MRLLSFNAVLAFVLALPLAPEAFAAGAKQKRSAHHARITQHAKKYGFLPGYRPPEVIERERLVRYWRSRPPWYGPAWPQFHHGRWNGGGYGPCYSSTPIGYIWTCGR
jgi:hypothetical protein